MPTTHCYRTINFLFFILLGLTLSLWLHAAEAAETATPAKPPQPSHPLQKGLEIGEGIWLNTEGGKFFAIYTPDQSNRPQGGAILLPDTNTHPDWPSVIHPLRRNLPEHGWATLAIELPATDNISAFSGNQKQIQARILAAIEQLKSDGISNIVLIGYGGGALAAANFLTTIPEHPIRGFVAVSLGQYDNLTPEWRAISLVEKINLPMLDIFAERDLLAVTESAPLRALAAKKSSVKASRDKQLAPFKRAGMATTPNALVKGYVAYRQVRIAGTDHDFSNSDTAFVKRILGWLNRHVAGVAINTAE
jgi:pimeloyl-ACP methyl ester carboxylesterase